ncbi:MAG: DNA alkylation repair protein [Pirellulales bacterium]|nr:DNA alkylation repair protein [Pirellulales bacterium]
MAKSRSTVANVPPTILRELNAGTRATRNLVEGLAIDFRLLIQSLHQDWPPRELARLAPGIPITRRMAAAAELLLACPEWDAFDQWRNHPSDTVRGWICFVVGQLPRLTLRQRLVKIRPLADDSHFGVREWAWLAVRGHLAAEVTAAIRLLTPWTESKSENLRRFACEALRPRGVWCAHLEELKAEPELALPILEPLRADASCYVQNSVGNWLNDAGKTQPHWVRDLCRRWQRESPGPPTDYICRRGLRNVGME